MLAFKSVRAHPLHGENPASPSEHPLHVEECHKASFKCEHDRS